MAAPEPMPMPKQRDAPSFSGNGREAKQFLIDFKDKADRAQLTPAQTIARIVNYVTPEIRKLVERYDEFRDATSTWAAFEKRFLEDYLDADAPEDFRRADYDEFLVKSKAEPPRSIDKLGQFTREFRAIAADVMRTGGLSEVEMRKHYATILEAATGDDFCTRMLVKYPAKSRSQWLIAEMLSEAKLLLKEAEADADAYFPQKVGVAAAPAVPSLAPGAQPAVKLEDQLVVLVGQLNARIQSLERTYRQVPASGLSRATTPTAAPYAAAAAAPPTGSAAARVPGQLDPCYYCGEPHRMHECPHMRDDLEKGRCLRNADGRIVYPNGEAIRGGFGGKMRERVHEFNLAHPEYEKKSAPAASAMLVELGDAYFATERDCDPRPTFSTEEAAQAWASFVYGESDADIFDFEEGERRRYNLRARQPGAQPQGPKVRTKLATAPASAGPAIREPPPHLESGRVDSMPPAREGSKDKSQSAGTAADRSGFAPAQPPTPARRSATIEEIPDVDAPHAPPALPRPVVLPSAMSAPRPQFKLQAPLETDGLAKIIGQRILASQVVLSVQELLAVSPSLRRHWHDQTATKRVTIGYAGAADAQDPAGVFHFERADQPSVSWDLIAAELALPLRYLDCRVGDFVAEGVLDNGSQLVLISQKFWQALGCPLDEEHRIRMTAANNSAALTRGLCANLEVQIGGIAFYLQAHVVEDAPFSLLLGRPFLCVASAKEENSLDGSTFITLNDPNSNRAARIPTRSRAAARSAPPPEGF